MANLSTQEKQELCDFLDNKLLQFISDERTPITNYANEATSSTALLELTGFTEKELDELLFMDDFKQHEVNITTTTKKHPSIALNPSFTTEPSTKAPPRIFAKAVSTKQIDETMQKGVPRKTQEDSRYCANLWQEWVTHRAATTGVFIPHLKDIKAEELQHWICAFVLEIRKKDGSEFIPNTLHHICAGIMRYLRTNGMPELDIFKQAGFSRFRMVLDSEMKRLQASGIGTVQKKAEPITFEEEEILWQKKILGDSTPQSLLDTMLYMNGLYFALHGGKEHRNLRYKPSQIRLLETPGERPYLMYIEDVSKNHPGGLKVEKSNRRLCIIMLTLTSQRDALLSFTNCTTVDALLIVQIMHII